MGNDKGGYLYDFAMAPAPADKRILGVKKKKVEIIKLLFYF